MFQLIDGRKQLYQWDLDQKIFVSNAAIKEVHFANITSTSALVVLVDEKQQAAIPNILLQQAYDLIVYAVDDNATQYHACFEVIERKKPDDYVYEEEEVLRFVELEKRIAELENGGSGGAVNSVNGKTGEVLLTAADVGALSNAEPVSIAYGGTGANTAKTARNNLDVYSKSEVDSAIANIDVDVDLSNYYNKSEVDALIPSLDGYAKSADIPDVSAYQTEAQVNALINSALAAITDGDEVSY